MKSEYMQKRIVENLPQNGFQSAEVRGCRRPNRAFYPSMNRLTLETKSIDVGRDLRDNSGKCYVGEEQEAASDGEQCLQRQRTAS